MQKWTTDTANPPGPIQVNKLNRALRELNHEHCMMIEKSGIIGKEERVWAVGKFSIGGENKTRPEVLKAQEDIGAKYGWTASRGNVNDILADIQAALPALQAARPVEDNRRTEEQEAASQAESKRIDEQWESKRKAENDAFLAVYGSGQEVEIQPGQMAVVAQLCFDNSDSQSDYFDSHATIGPALVLMVCRQGREDQATARAGLNRFPELANLGEWTWHTEKWSMGHGNYLSGPGVDIPKEAACGRTYYQGGEVDRGHWEIQFAWHPSDGKLPTFKGWPGVVGAAPSVQSVGEATVSENKEKGGVEIRFPSKPEGNILEALKSHGWRWSRFAGCWYKRADEKTLAWAKALIGQGGTAEAA